MDNFAPSKNRSDKLTSHSGTDLDDVVIALNPPKSIGKLLSAQSTERVQQPPQKTLNRLFVALVIGAVVCGCLFLLLSIASDVIRANLSWSPVVSFAIAFSGGSIVSILTWFVRRRHHELTFVGVDGIARFSRFEGQPPTDLVEEVLLFRDVSELRRSVTNIYVNQAYGGSNYWFAWFNSLGEQYFTIRGAFRCEALSPPKGNDYYFAVAAERAWNAFQEIRLLNELEQNGTARFRVLDSDFFQVGRGFLDCTFHNRTTRLASSDMSCLKMDDGTLHIESQSKKIYRGQRVCRIMSGRISNLFLLLQMLQRYGGFTIEEADFSV